MSKTKILPVLLAGTSVLVLVLAALQLARVNDQNPPAGIEKRSPDAEEFSGQKGKQPEPETINPDIDTSNWKAYRNEEYGFEFRYPADWHWEDFRGKFRSPIVGLFPKDKQEGWEYLGDIQVSAFNKPAEESIVDFYKRTKQKELTVSENTVRMKSLNGYEMIIEKDSAGNIDSDIVIIDCDDKALQISSPFGQARKTLTILLSTVTCL